MTLAACSASRRAPASAAAPSGPPRGGSSSSPAGANCRGLQCKARNSYVVYCSQLAALGHNVITNKQAFSRIHCCTKHVVIRLTLWPQEWQQLGSQGRLPLHAAQHLGVVCRLCCQLQQDAGFFWITKKCFLHSTWAGGSGRGLHPPGCKSRGAHRHSAASPRRPPAQRLLARGSAPRRSPNTLPAAAARAAPSAAPPAEGLCVVRLV